MTSDPHPQPADRADDAPAGDSPEVVAVFRAALRGSVLLVVVVTVLGVGIGALVAGTPGVWGALIGAGLALVFSGATTVSMLRTAHSSPSTMMAVVMGTWLGKIVLVVVLLAVLRGMDFYDRYVLAAVVAAATIGSAVVDLLAVSRGRVPYVAPVRTSPKVPVAEQPDKSGRP
ncbi:MAG TPA: hypothetical protein VGC67_02835 [Cellulomonas sp.]